MKNKEVRTNRKRTIQDRIISGYNNIRYYMIENIQLKITRALYEKFYSNPFEDPLVTIYTPTYNRGEILIDRALSSILAQTYQNFEYLIIGDCCTDNTENLLSEVRDPRVRFINMQSKSKGYPQDAESRWLAGPVVPANKALEIARGRWIARLDDDDSFTPDHIEVLLRFAQKENHEFVSSLLEEERFGKKIVLDGVRTCDPYFNRGKEIKSNNDDRKIGGTSTWLYRSYLRFIKYNIHCWRKDWNRVNDTDLSMRIFNAGTRMGFLDEVTTHVLPRPGEKTIGLEAYLLSEKEGYAVHN